VAADNPLTLTEEQLDRLADRVAIRLAATKPPAKPMLTVDDVCTTFQVSRAWVYENASDREQKRAKMMQDPDWKHFLSENAKAGNVIEQNTSLMIPASFAPKIPMPKIVR